MRKFFAALTMILGLSACQNYYLSPSVIYRNASPNGSEIKNIQVVWNGYRLLENNWSYDLCRSGGGQSFNLRKKSDLFGPVHAEWENAKGKKISKDFIFRKKDLTSNPYHLSTIILFFTQTDVEYYTSDNPRIKEIELEKSGNWVNKWFEEEGERRCVNDPIEAKRFKKSK